MPNTEILWSDKPKDHDYPAAESYLELLYDRPTVKKYIRGMMKAPISKFKAKDIFRASKEPLLDGRNGHVAKDIKRIRTDQKLSPILLVRDPTFRKVIIADGYHRLCAVYSFDEDAWVSCKIV